MAQDRVPDNTAVSEAAGQADPLQLPAGSLLIQLHKADARTEVGHAEHLSKGFPRPRFRAKWGGEPALRRKVLRSGAVGVVPAGDATRRLVR